MHYLYLSPHHMTTCHHYSIWIDSWRLQKVANIFVMQKVVATLLLCLEKGRMII